MTSTMEENIRSTLKDIYTEYLKTYEERHGSHWEYRYPSQKIYIRNPPISLMRVVDFKKRQDITNLNKTNSFQQILSLPRCIPVRIDAMVSQREASSRPLILLEGAPGTCKSLCLYKLLTDWCRSGTTKTKFKMDRFKFVLYFNCALFKNKYHDNHNVVTNNDLTDPMDKIVSFAYDFLLPADNKFSENDLYRCLCKYEKDTMIIFDSYETNSAMISKLISNGKKSSLHAHIIVACQSGYVRDRGMFAEMFLSSGVQQEFSIGLIKKYLSETRSADLTNDLFDTIRGSVFLQHCIRCPGIIQVLTSEILDICLKNYVDEFSLIHNVAHELGILTMSVELRESLDDHQSQRKPFLVTFAERSAYTCWYKGLTRLYSSENNSGYKFLAMSEILKEELPLKKTQTFQCFSFCHMYMLEYFASNYVIEKQTGIGMSLCDAIRRIEREPSFYKFVIGNSACHNNEDLTQSFLKAVFHKLKQKYIKLSTPTGSQYKARLHDIGKDIRLVNETFLRDYLRQNNLTTILPHILEVSASLCSTNSINDLIQLMTAHACPIKTFILHIDDTRKDNAFGIPLATAINICASVNSVIVNSVYIADLNHFVVFLCKIFSGNFHVNNLTLGGPLRTNSLISPACRRMIKTSFKKNIALKHLHVQRISNYYTVPYVLKALPLIYEKLTIMDCNLERSSDVLSNLAIKSPFLKEVKIDHCCFPTTMLAKFIDSLANARKLQMLTLNLISCKRSFTVAEYRKPSFKLAFNSHVCDRLKKLISRAESLVELNVCQNQISTEGAATIFDGVLDSTSLTLVDLSGNLIDNGIADNVVLVYNKCDGMKNLQLGNNHITKDGRNDIIRQTFNRNDIKISL